MIRTLKSLFIGTAALLISACSNTEQGNLYFASDSGEVALEPSCLQNVSMEQDLEGREFISVGIAETESCYGEIDTWIQNHIGEEVELIFSGETVSGPSPVLGPLPANDITITSDNHEILSDVYNHISD